MQMALFLLLAFWFGYSVTSGIHLVGNAKAAGKPAAEKQPAQKSKGHAHPEQRRARGSSVLLVYLSGMTPRPSSALHLARCFEAKKKRVRKKTFPRSERKLPGRSARRPPQCAPTPGSPLVMFARWRHSRRPCLARQKLRAPNERFVDVARGL